MRRSILCSIAILAWVGMASVPVLAASEMDQKVDHALQFAKGQLKRSVAQTNDPTVMVRSTQPNGSWRTIKPGDWTSGFFPGLLWFASEYSNEPDFRKWAEEWTAALEEQKNNTGDHDTGFRIFCSYGNGCRITHRSEYRDVILTAARSLATRFNPMVGCIRSWDHGTWTFPVIIDNMMNLEMLFWASKNGGDPAWYDLAVKHATATMQNHVRPDGGTFHVVDYDKETGAILKKVTHQGFRDDSTWSRGHAWSIYGFTVAYRETGEKKFLNTARKLASYFISHLPQDPIPFWDFQASNLPNEPRDSSAAAIATSGLLELSTLVPDQAEKQQFREAALNLLSALCSPEYLAEGTKLSSLLQHATGSKPHDSEIDVGLIYGDYYFLEALLRYQDPARIPKPSGKPRRATSAGHARISVTAENPMSMERASETLSVPWVDLVRLQPALRLERVEVIDKDSGKTVVSQAIDVDLNGTIDELIFQSDFKPLQHKAFTIQSLRGADSSKADSKAFGMFYKEREDFAWENDRIAFRMYGPWLRKELISSGVDVWVKKVRSPIIEKWYAPGHNYHLDSGEGLDFYQVDTSRGCGGTALWKDEKMFLSDNFSSHKILANGPIRVLFELKYDVWNAEGTKVSELKRISLDAGQNLSKHEVYYTCEPKLEEIQEAIGVLHHGGTHVANDRDFAWIAVWGSPDKSGNGELGTGIVVDRKRWIRFADSGNQFLAITSANPGKAAVHYAGAGWSKSGDFSNAADWYAYIDKFAQKLNNPIKISLTKPL